MSDLIERLRDKKRLRAAHGLTGWVLADESLHTEAADEIERLTAALQHEADCVEAAKAEIERLQIGIELFEAADADLRTKLDAESDLAGMIAAERDELRRQLDEAELDARRYRWLRNEANTARKCDPMVCIYPLDEQDLIDGDRLDIAIDAAMGLTRPAEES